MNVVHYDSCPVCDSRNIDPLLNIKDNSVSGEEFVVWQCAHCSLRFTQDVPNEENIEPYYKSPDYISHTNTDKGVINKLYQRVRKYTLQQKKELLIKTTGLQHGTLLDVGAGVGAFLATMKNSGWQVQGLEPDEEAHKLAQSTFELELQPANELENLPSENFDAITLWHVLEHVHQLQEYITQLKKLLKKNGKLFIAVPNYQSLDSEIYKLYWAAYDVPRHLYHFAPKSIEVLMQKHGLTVEAKKPMWFDAFYISLLSSKYKNGSSNWVGAGWAGVRSNLNALANKNKCSSLIYIIKKA